MQGLYSHKRQASRDVQPFAKLKPTAAAAPHLMTSNLPPSMGQPPSHHSTSPFTFMPPLQLSHSHPLQSVQEQQEKYDSQTSNLPTQSQSQMPSSSLLYQQQPPQISLTGPTPSTYNAPQAFPQPANKRVWVKRPGKTATTLMVGPSDIVDDLKSLVVLKYPTSLAVQVDPSDLVVKMELSLSLSPSGPGVTSQAFKTDSHTKMHSEPPSLVVNSIGQTGSYTRTTPVGGKSAGKKTRPSTVENQLSYLKSSVSPVAPVPLSTSKSSLLQQKSTTPEFVMPVNGKILRKSSTGSLTHNKTATPSTVALEPDMLVWKILDQYFPTGMRMQDAFLVEPPSTTTDPILPVPPSSRMYAPLGRATAPPHYGSIAELEGRTTPQTLLQSSAVVTGPKPHATPRELNFPNNPEYSTSVDSSFSFKTAILGDSRTLPSPRDAKFTRQGSVDPLPAASSTVILFPKTKKAGSKSPTPVHQASSNNSSSLIQGNIHNSSGTTGSASTNEQPTATSGATTVTAGSNTSTSTSSKKQDESPGKKPKSSSTSSTTKNVKSKKSNKHKVKNPMTISMRQKQPNGSKKQPQVGLSKILSHVNVLVVEDNLVNQKIMARHLKSCNVMYKVAQTGQEALEMWKEGGFQLCFMDIQLPVMTGIEVAQKIRRLERLNHIGNFAQSSSYNRPHEIQNIDASDKLNLDQFRSPIIIVALTASTSAKDKQDALAAGCNDYLTKPVQLKWLRNKLTEWGCMQALINYERFRSNN